MSGIMASRLDALPAPHSGARSLLLTMLGEFVRPSGGSVWTSTVVDGLGTVGITERNARQAVARLGEQGIVEPERIGRRTRWQLTDAGERLLTAGAERIYSFGSQADSWTGAWLLVSCQIPDRRRAVRHRYRTQLAFEGFGSLTPNLTVSPHPDREKAANDIITSLGLADLAMTFIARSGEITDDAEILATAWDLDGLAERYAGFIDAFDDMRDPAGNSPTASFAATLQLVDAWRRFPFADPELPTELLPSEWIGTRARVAFEQVRARHAADATAWFATAEADAA